MAGKRALNQIPFDFIEAHFLELCGAAGGLRAQTQISGAHRWSGRHQHAAFDSMIQLADVSRPGVFVKSPDRGGVKAGNIFAVAVRIPLQKMVRQKIDVLAAVPQRRNVDLDGVQAKEKVLPKTPRTSL